ncbi:MAG: TolC family protein [Sandaracinaceae bacterium]|nr:TolC family protein [Sandaracinaceae bacterium]
MGRVRGGRWRNSVAAAQQAGAGLVVTLALSTLAPAGALAQARDSVSLPSPLPPAVEVTSRPPTSPATSIVEPLDLERVLRGEGQGLTADEVARRAVATAPTIAQGRAQLEQARAGAAQAYLAFFPRLDLTARYTRLSPITQGTLGNSSITPEQEDMLRTLIGNVADPSAQALFTVNLESQLALANFTFPVLLDSVSLGAEIRYPVSDVFFQVLPSYEGAERAVDAQETQMQATASAVSQQAREAFYTYARARAATAVAESTVRTIEAQERVVQSAVDAGVTPRVDLMRLRAQLAAARVAVERARGGTATAAEALRALMHEDGRGEIPVAEDLLAGLPELEGSREDLILRAYSERPESRAIAHLLRARDRQIEAAEGSRYPHLVLDGQFSFDNPNQRLFPAQQRFVENYTLSVILTWSPNDLFAGEERARQARAQRAESEAQLDQLHDGIRIQVTQSYEAYRAARLSLDAAHAGIEAAEEGVRVRTEQYRAGAGLITELMAATADLARAQLDLVSAAIDARIAHTQLVRAIGADGPYDLAR